MLLSALTSPFIKDVTKIIDKVVVNKDEANRLKSEIKQSEQKLLNTEIENAAKTIISEAQGSYLQRNWRPILMLVVTAIIINNYLLFPWFSLFGIPVPDINLPDKLWNLLILGVGGYVIGRSGEKIMRNYNSTPSGK